VCLLKYIRAEQKKIHKVFCHLFFSVKTLPEVRVNKACHFITYSKKTNVKTIVFVSYLPKVGYCLSTLWLPLLIKGMVLNPNYPLIMFEEVLSVYWYMNSSIHYSYGVQG
jgi:hypothetical protein